MKKIICIILTLVLVFSMSLTALAASVTPVEYPGNDANPADYTPPTGCVRTTLPDSDVVGTHVYKFNGNGVLDPAGTNMFTLVVGIETGTSYTQVLFWEWSGDYPLFAVIAKGGPGFNLYEYNGAVTSDTNLVSPDVSSGQPADISHVSVVLCPNGQPPVPPDGELTCCIIIVVLLAILLVLLTAVLFTLIKLSYMLCFTQCHKHHDHHECHEHPGKPKGPKC